MSENFPNLTKERDIQVQKCRVQNKMNLEAYRSEGGRRENKVSPEQPSAIIRTISVVYSEQAGTVDQKLPETVWLVLQ